MSRIVLLPDVAFAVLMVVGGVFATAGAIAFVFSFMIDRVERTMAQVAYGDCDSKYVCTHARPHDLPGLHALYARYFGSDVPTRELMHAWVAKCGSAFTLVHRVLDESGLATQRQLVGSFKLIPLTARGVRAIDLGQATGSNLRLEHVCGGRSRAAGYWVGDVVATTRFARGVVMAHLNAALSGKTADIYARPLTSDGLRVMMRHGFVQVSDGKSVPAIGKTCILRVGSLAEHALKHPAKPRRLTSVAGDNIAAAKNSDS